MSFSEQRLELPGNASLVMRVFAPAGMPRASVVLCSAMAVEQGFYERFASWLAQHGYLVATFDCRGIGRSAPADLRELDVDIVTWAQQDCTAVIAHMKQLLPDAPLYWIGHSLGGQVIGLLEQRHCIERAVIIASGSGYWLHNAWPTLRMVWWLWFVVVPLALRAGYFPGRGLRKLTDLPAGVMRQWRRWCLHADYLFAVEGAWARQQYAALRIPMLSLSFTDDEMMSVRSSRALQSWYAQARLEARRIDPRSLGVARIGHFGFFRSQVAELLWPQVVQWLESPVAGQGRNDQAEARLEC